MKAAVMLENTLKTPQTMLQMLNMLIKPFLTFGHSIIDLCYREGVKAVVGYYDNLDALLPRVKQQDFLCLYWM